MRKRKQISLMDGYSLKEKIIDAGTKATDYITSITGTDGISVHDAEDTSNYVNITSGMINLVTGGVSKIAAYVENGVAKVRIGAAAARHVLFSEDVSVRDGTTELARFGANGSQIGQNSKSHLNQDYHSIELVDKEGNTYFHVSDLRDAQGRATIKDYYYGNGDQRAFELTYSATTTTYSVKVDGTEVTSGITKKTYAAMFDTAPSSGAEIVIEYYVTSIYVKAYTLGLRKSGTNIGGMSVAEGDDVTASGRYCHVEGKSSVAEGYASHAEGLSTKAYGYYSHAEGANSQAGNKYSHALSPDHAEGYSTKATGGSSHSEGLRTTASGAASHAEGVDTTASGEFSHAEGDSVTASGYAAHASGRGTIAQGPYQTAIGTYNVAQGAADTRYASDRAFMIGYGSESSRYTSFSVDWNGTTRVGGSVVHSSDRRLKEHIDYLGDEAAEFVRELKPVHYIKDSLHHVGFYAQDVEKIDKWHCMVDEMNGFKTLGYMELIAPLVAYCQHLEERIEKLERSK